ncbi:MAG: hypothetical protein COA58_12605 [Bacteroidetes bacterium]|nr:MAG: hypothetical protein COA58_12605 [Bacteroidota bacterium]
MRFVIAACIFLSILSCSKIKNKASEAAGEVGEVVGQTGSEFIKGVGDGSGITLECDLELSEKIKEMNIFNGHYDVNVAGVEIYAIFEKDVNDSAMVVLRTEDGLEYARSKM